MLTGLLSDGFGVGLDAASAQLSIFSSFTLFMPYEECCFRLGLTPRALAAARRTMGVSSLHKVVNIVLNSP